MCVIGHVLHNWEDSAMRTTVVLDDDLMRTALELSGFKTKKKAIEEGLKLLVKLNRQKSIKSLRGKMKWTGSE